MTYLMFRLMMREVSRSGDKLMGCQKTLKVVEASNNFRREVHKLDNTGYDGNYSERFSHSV